MSGNHSGDRHGAAEHYADYWALHRERVERGYVDRAALQQAFFVGLHSRDVVEALSSHNGHEGPLRVLNAGCGQGTWSVPLAQARMEVVNLDLSDDALALARRAFERHGLHGEFIRGNMLRLPFADGSFDGVVNFGVLEHFEDLKPVFTEMARVLKPGGVVVVEVITDRFCVQSIQTAINAALSIAWNFVRLRWARMARVLRNPHKGFYENSYSYRAYETFLREAGLTQVTTRGVRAFPFVALPRWGDYGYARLLRALASPLRRFDRSGSAWSKSWGAIWALQAVKPST